MVSIELLDPIRLDSKTLGTVIPIEMVITACRWKSKGGGGHEIAQNEIEGKSGKGRFNNY